MKTKLPHLLLIAITLLFAVKSSKAQQFLIHYWDYNQTQPASGSGGDSLGTLYSYANTFAVDNAHNTFQLLPTYTRIPGGNPKEVEIRPQGKQLAPLVCTLADSLLDNGSAAGSFFYDFAGYGYNYINVSDSSGPGGNMYVRARNPTENEYTYLYLPTTGFKNINFNFAQTASSAKGAKFMIFSYSKDGGVTWNKLTGPMDTFNVSHVAYPDSLMAINPQTTLSQWVPHQINFSSDAGVNNNPNFVLRWQYEGTNCNVTSGNLRFDNFSLFGDSNTAGVVAIINRRYNAGPCFGDSNGSARVYALGGTAPYTFSWSNNATNSKAAGGLSTDSAFGLKPGTYTVNVTDAGSNTALAYVTILQPSQIIPTPTVTNISCNGGNNGKITLFTAGGTPHKIAPGYKYSWAPSGGTNSTASSLTAGTYTCTVTDSLGCVGQAIVPVMQPTAISVTTSTLPVTCVSTGSATATPSGGTPYVASTSYKYAWTSGSTNSLAPGLGAGTYTVIATDSLGCTGSATATVTTLGAVVTLTPTDLTCNGSSNGSIISNVTGGSIPYTYNWSNGATTTSINGLSAGTYTLTITEHNGCIDNGITTVTQPGILKDTIISVTPVQQLIHYWDFNSTQPSNGGGAESAPYLGDSLGNAANPLNADFTTIPSAHPHLVYSHPQLTPAQILAGDFNFMDNAAGPAYSYVNDLHAAGNDSGGVAAGNLFVRNRNPTQGSEFIWYIPTTGYENINLNWALSASSGKGAQDLIFTYSKDGGITWNKLTAAMDTFNTGGHPHPDTLNGINPITSSSNWYPVHVDLSSDPGCNNNPNLQFMVKYGGSNIILTSGNNRWDNISVKGATIPKVSCNNGNNGSAAASISGGTAPFTYNWSTGTTTDTASNLVVGINTVTVTDAHGCSVTASVTVINPPVLSAVINVNNGCNNANNGTETAVPSGGTGPYSYLWSNANTGNEVSGLAPATYTVTVTDVDGCTVTVSATITNPPVLTVTITPTPVTCNGLTNGSAVASGNGGTAPYTYQWGISAGGFTIATATGLKAANDTVSVTDADGCTAIGIVTITQPPVLSVTIGAPTENGCFGGNSGSATANPVGGTSPYTFTWSNGATVATASGLTSGTYTVTVTDANSCGPVMANVTITEPPTPVSVSTTTTNTTCAVSVGTADVSASGGTPGYNYLWSTGATTTNINSLSAGVYTVAVTDNNGCVITATATVTPLGGPRDSVTATVDNVCFGGNSGSITVGVNRGSPGYTFAWSNGETKAMATGLTSGTYSVLVTDAAGCTATASATLTSPSQLRDSASSITNILCNFYSTGSATAGVKGGITPYVYNWAPSGGTNATANNLSAGAYTLTVTDNNGCTATSSVTLTQPPAIVDSVSSINSGCVGKNNGTVTVGVRGGVSPYAYNWTPSGGTKVTATGLSAGTYTVSVVDNNSCLLFLTVNITPDSIPVVTFKPGKDSVACDTLTTLALGAFGSPGGGVFTGPHVSGNTFHPFAAGVGTYTIKYVYTNGGGCSDSATQKIRVDSCNALGIDELQQTENAVRIYPNPSSGQFTISGLIKGSTLQLYNDIGMLISTGKVTDETMQLNIGAMADGVYMVRVIYQDGTKVISQKVIKLH